MKRFLKSKEFTIFFIILVISAIITINNKTFLRMDNIIDLLKANSVIGILSMGMLLAILTGGIDVSIGAVMAATSIIIGQFMVQTGANVFLVFLVSCIGGIAFGMINGILIAKLKLPAIVATLGTLSIVNGLVLYKTNGKWIDTLPSNFADFGKIVLFQLPNGSGGKIGFPIQIVFFIVAALLTWFILKYTLVGRGIYAVGGDKVSAERIGYKIDLIHIFIYTYIGLMVGIASFVHTSIMKQVDPNAFIGIEMQAIAAVVIGGANILGGEGSVFGTILGVILLAAMNNGLIIMHIPVFWQKIIIGLVIILAVSVNVIQNKRREKTKSKIDVDETENDLEINNVSIN